MAFTKKLLRFTFDLAGDQTFDNTGANRLTISGLRASVTIEQAGSAALGKAEITIYGMTLSQMNRLSTLGQKVSFVRKNVVTVEAGDANGMAQVYQGNILQGWADFTAMPQAAFRIAVSSSILAQVQPIPPTTVNGPADVATIMAGLANQGNFHFENNGVTATLYYPYFPGTVKEQIKRCADHAGITWTIDEKTGTLAIWPKGSARGSQTQIVSSDTGMIGFPVFNSLGVQIRSLYNPSLTFGQRIQVQSKLTAANQEWIISSLTHSLDAATPGGQWHTNLIATWPGQVVVAPVLGR